MASQPPGDELLTPGGVAALLFVDPKTVTRWARAGKIEAIRTPGGHRRFLKSDVLAIMAGLHQRQNPDLVPISGTGEPMGAAEARAELEAAAAAVVADAVAIALEAEAEAAAEAVLVITTAVAEAAEKASHAAARAQAAAQATRHETARAAASVASDVTAAAAHVARMVLAADDTFEDEVASTADALHLVTAVAAERVAADSSARAAGVAMAAREAAAALRLPSTAPGDEDFEFPGIGARLGG